jgi:hypothetical protein
VQLEGLGKSKNAVTSSEIELQLSGLDLNHECQKHSTAAISLLLLIHVEEQNL